MSRLTTYFRGTDGFAIGTAGEVIGEAFQTAAVYGRTSNQFPFPLLSACDGGIPVLLKNIVFDNGGAGFSSATVWSRMPVNSFVTSVRIQISPSPVGGTFATYWQDSGRATYNRIVWLPVGGTGSGTPALPTNANATTYLSLSNNSNINQDFPVLRFDVVMPATLVGTINAWLEYVIVPPDDV